MSPYAHEKKYPLQFNITECNIKLILKIHFSQTSYLSDLQEDEFVQAIEKGFATKIKLLYHICFKRQRVLFNQTLVSDLLRQQNVLLNELETRERLDRVRGKEQFVQILFEIIENHTFSVDINVFLLCNVNINNIYTITGKMYNYFRFKFF